MLYIYYDYFSNIKMNTFDWKQQTKIKSNRDYAEKTMKKDIYVSQRYDTHRKVLVFPTKDCP